MLPKRLTRRQRSTDDGDSRVDRINDMLDEQYSDLQRAGQRVREMRQLVRAMRQYDNVSDIFTDDTEHPK